MHEQGVGEKFQAAPGLQVFRNRFCVVSLLFSIHFVFEGMDFQYVVKSNCSLLLQQSSES